MPDALKLLTAGETAKALGITVDTLQRLRKLGRIKGYKLIRKYRYDLDEVKKALAK